MGWGFLEKSNYARRRLVLALWQTTCSHFPMVGSKVVVPGLSDLAPLFVVTSHRMIKPHP